MSVASPCVTQSQKHQTITFIKIGSDKLPFSQLTSSALQAADIMSCCIVHNNLHKISGKQLPKKFCFLSFSCIQKQQQEDNLHIYTKASLPELLLHLQKQQQKDNLHVSMLPHLLCMSITNQTQ